MGQGLCTRQWCPCFLWGTDKRMKAHLLVPGPFPSPGLALVDCVLGTRATSWRLPRRLPDALLCGESLRPPLTMRTSVPRHHPQDVAVWCPGACMCLPGEHRGLLLILKMQTKHLLSHMSYSLPGAVTNGAGRGVVARIVESEANS